MDKFKQRCEAIWSLYTRGEKPVTPSTACELSAQLYETIKEYGVPYRPHFINTFGAVHVIMVDPTCTHPAFALGDT